MEVALAADIVVQHLPIAKVRRVFCFNGTIMDGVLDIYDLGVVITHLITKISEKVQRGSAPQAPHLKGQQLA